MEGLILTIKCWTVCLSGLIRQGSTTLCSKRANNCQIGFVGRVYSHHHLDHRGHCICAKVVGFVQEEVEDRLSRMWSTYASLA